MDTLFRAIQNVSWLTVKHFTTLRAPPSPRSKSAAPWPQKAVSSRSPIVFQRPWTAPLRLFPLPSTACMLPGRVASGMLCVSKFTKEGYYGGTKSEFWTHCPLGSTSSNICRKLMHALLSAEWRQSFCTFPRPHLPQLVLLRGIITPVPLAPAAAQTQTSRFPLNQQVTGHRKSGKPSFLPVAHLFPAWMLRYDVLCPNNL